MKNIFFFYLLIIPTIVSGQNDSTQLFEPMQIKADIDTLIYKLMDAHPTFSNHYKTNIIKSKVEAGLLTFFTFQLEVEKSGNLTQSFSGAALASKLAGHSPAGPGLRHASLCGNRNN